MTLDSKFTAKSQLLSNHFNFQPGFEMVSVEPEESRISSAQKLDLGPRGTVAPGDCCLAYIWIIFLDALARQYGMYPTVRTRIIH